MSNLRDKIQVRYDANGAHLWGGRADKGLSFAREYIIACAGDYTRITLHHILFP